jgi:hypothetical protein
VSFYVAAASASGATRLQKERSGRGRPLEEARTDAFAAPDRFGARSGFRFEVADDVKVIRSRIYAPAVSTCTVLTS